MGKHNFKELYFRFDGFTDANNFIVAANQNGGPYGEKYLAACEYIVMPPESAINLR